MYDIVKRSIRQIRRFPYALSGSFVARPEFLAKNVKVIKSHISGDVSIGEHSTIRSSTISVAKATIGRHSVLWGPDISVYAAINPISIGNFCSFAKNVTIQEYNHRIDRISTHFVEHNLFSGMMESDIVSKGPIRIGNDVWLATNVVITSGVCVGDGAVIGANSVVTNDIPPYAVAAGAPARIVRYRFPGDEIRRLLAMCWWDWSDEDIKASKQLFVNPFQSSKIDH